MGLGLGLLGLGLGLAGPSRRREKVLDCESIQMRSEMCRSESMGTW